MDQLSRHVEYAQFLIQTAKQKPSDLVKQSSSASSTNSSKGKSIHQKLVDLYVEESSKQQDDKDLLLATHLLPKLVKRDRLNCLVLKLYPANEGYSLMLRGRSGIESETVKLPYEVSELLEYVDASELPPFLVDLLEKAQVNVFYNGCVIVEVRDYRRSTSGGYDTQYVLLKPTQQTLLADIYNICNDGHRWTQEDQFTLESQLLLATEEPVCLDPSPSVLLVANKLQYERKNLNTQLLKKSVKKFTQAALNRKRKMAQGPAPKELKLYDFLHKKRTRVNPPVNLKLGKPSVDMWKQKPVTLSAPESVEVDRLATLPEQPETKPDGILELVEEHTLERDVSQDKKLLARLSIKLRPSDNLYLGELYLDHDYKEGSQGSTCTYSLGNRQAVDKYLQQFKEIFTEEGRRAVKITTQKPGQPPHVEYTQTSLTSSSQGITISGTQALLTTARHSTNANTSTTQTPSEQAPTTAALVAGKRNLPIQLSLTIGPAATAGTTQASGQLQWNIQKQNMTTSQTQNTTQRSKIGHLSSVTKPASTPSPITTPTTTLQGLNFSQGLTTSTAVFSGSGKLTQAPPNTTITTPISVARKLSGTVADSVSVSQLTPGIQQTGNIAFVQSSGSDSSTGTTNITQQPGVANINIANLTGLPPNINIQNITGLPGVNIANIQGLQNMQVSLTAVSVPGGGIAVPVPISVISNTGVLQNPSGSILVSSLPGVAAVSSTTASSSGALGLNNPQKQSSTATIGSAPTTLVTMVSALPSATTASTSVSTTSVTSNLVVTSGVISAQSSVLTSPAGMLSLPINLTQFVSAGLKQQPGSGIRGPTTVPLLQIQGQPGLQLLGLPQQRPPLKAGTTLTGQQSAQGHTAGKTSAIPTTAVLTAQSLTSQQIAALSQQLKPGGQTTGGTLSTQQLMQIQQLHFKQQQPIQLHPVQLKQQPTGQVGTSVATGAGSSGSKSKSKKRTTPTPPKN